MLTCKCSRSRFLKACVRKRCWSFENGAACGEGFVAIRCSWEVDCDIRSRGSILKFSARFLDVYGIAPGLYHSPADAGQQEAGHRKISTVPAHKHKIVEMAQSGGISGPSSDDVGTSNPSINLRGDSSRNVPIYVLFLIMLSSGIFTLIFLWICVQYVYHKRMVRQALRDLEQIFVVERAWEAEGMERTQQETPSQPDGITPNAPKLSSDGKGCDNKVELTYVVMAGEDQPTFLARPLSTSQESTVAPKAAV